MCDLQGGEGSRGNKTQRQLCKLTLGGSTLIEGSAGAKRSLLDVTAKNSEHLLIPSFIGNPGSPLVIYILFILLNAPNSFLKYSDLPKLSDCTCGHDCIKRGEKRGRLHPSSVKSLLLQCELVSVFIIHIVLPKALNYGVTFKHSSEVLSVFFKCVCLKLSFI